MGGQRRVEGGLEIVERLASAGPEQHGTRPIALPKREQLEPARAQQIGCDAAVEAPLGLRREGPGFPAAAPARLVVREERLQQRSDLARLAAANAISTAFSL